MEAGAVVMIRPLLLCEVPEIGEVADNLLRFVKPRQRVRKPFVAIRCRRNHPRDRRLDHEPADESLDPCFSYGVLPRRASHLLRDLHIVDLGPSPEGAEHRAAQAGIEVEVEAELLAPPRKRRRNWKRANMT